MHRSLQQFAFVFRFRYLPRVSGWLRKTWFSCWGMRVGQGTVLPAVLVTWPHQIIIGSNCLLEENIRFKFDGLWRPGPSIQIKNRVFIGAGVEFNITASIIVGDDSLIAAGCRFIDHNHGLAMNELIRTQLGEEQPIILENNVWLGCNVVVLKGVTIGSGAVIAASSVVTKSVLPNEIWAGIPARKIGQRSPSQPHS